MGYTADYSIHMPHHSALVQRLTLLVVQILIVQTLGSRNQSLVVWFLLPPPRPHPGGPEFSFYHSQHVNE